MNKPLQNVLLASDLDGTLVKNDTLFDFFAEHGLLEEAKEINKIEPGADAKIVLKKIIASKKLRVREIAKFGDSAQIYPGAKNFLKKMEGLGAKVCILTATYFPIAKRVTERLGLKNAIICATKLHTSTGIVRGLDENVMEGKEKLGALENACRREGIDLDSVVGIGDSESDDFFLQAADEAGGLAIKVSTPNFVKIEKINI